MAYREPTPLELAKSLLDQATAAESPEEAARALAAAQTYALLEIAKWLDRIEDAINGVSRSLTDQQGFGPGNHLRHINDWVERIAKDGLPSS